MSLGGTKYIKPNSNGVRTISPVVNEIFRRYRFKSFVDK